MSLCKTWNVAIGNLYGLPVQTHCRYVMHISQQNHVDHVLKCRFSKFMVGNLRSKNLFISHIVKVCFKNVSTISGCTVSMNMVLILLKWTLHMALEMKWHCSIGKHYLIVLKGRSGKLI